MTQRWLFRYSVTAALVGWCLILGLIEFPNAVAGAVLVLCFVTAFVAAALTIRSNRLGTLLLLMSEGVTMWYLVAWYMRNGR